MRLDTESLRTLKATIEAGSLTVAAQQLSMTTSAVSWRRFTLKQNMTLLPIWYTQPIVMPGEPNLGVCLCPVKPVASFDSGGVLRWTKWFEINFVH